MAKLPPEIQTSKTVEAIYAAYKQRGDAEPPRDYLGASEIGEDCARKLWYDYRQCGQEDKPGRIYRLFKTGDIEEQRIIDDLRAIGCQVETIDPDTGKQYRFTEFGGHFSGGFDGAVLGIPEAPKTWHLLEVKSHNDKRFKEVAKKGVKEAKPKHYAQMQTYMGKFGFKRGLYVAVNKDNDEIYTERIEYEAVTYQANVNKALRIIQATEPPTKLSDDPGYFACKFCHHNKRCHGATPAPLSCRTCVHSTPVTDRDGKVWRCEKYAIDIPPEHMATGCDDHLYIPTLLPFAEPLDSGDGWVLYKVKDTGAEFVNCAASEFPGQSVPHYASRELVAVDHKAIGNPELEAARSVLGAEVIDGDAA